MAVTKSITLMSMRFLLIILIIFSFFSPAFADETKSILVRDSIDSASDTQYRDSVLKPYRFRPYQLIVPVTLIGVGFIGLGSDWVKKQNSETRDELQEHQHPKLTVDDFTQYAPLAAIYGLKLLGVKSRHDYVDMTIITATAYLLTGISVYSLKSLTKVERPDGSSRNSFPSGHTATAFAGAHLLLREYWNTSPWIGVAGYVVASGTGFLRMYNNRHWLTDVLAGAGIGILSAEAAYWLYPFITRTLFKKRHDRLIIAPAIDTKSIGFSAQIRF